ncbi:MAG: hypothetical protein QE485_12510 [Acidovorax sp.]|uniref:hypothetical protein n=1 Tax=Acidovorax sp. TaxID=1872122 RepID=UPI00261C1753|nr:hypothetical protein [Acidovorax sp.]MDH4418037.1 hypothetical protein [Acidovorax sp.]
MIRPTRRAPAVLYPVRRSMALGVALVVLLMAGAAVLWAWLAEGAALSWVSVCTAGGLWLVAAAGAVHFWTQQFVGSLRWDGQGWVLEGDGPEKIFRALSAPPEVLLDLQAHLWVCVSPWGHHRTWLWLERASQPERWLDMRRAVYSRAVPGADNPDATAPATAVGRES